MKINDVLNEGWQDGLRKIFGSIYNAWSNGEADAERVIESLAKQAQQQWVRMVANLRRNYKERTDIPKRQLAGFLMQLGTPMRVGNPSKYSTAITRSSKDANGKRLERIYADSEKVLDAFNTIYSETVAGRENGGGVYNALVAALEEAIVETQRKALNPHAQPAGESPVQPAADPIKRTELNKYHGEVLAGTEFDGLVNPNKPEYKNAIIPVDMVSVTYQPVTYRGGRRKDQVRWGETRPEEVASEKKRTDRFIRLNGKWYIDYSQSAMAAKLEPYEDTARATILNSLISNVLTATGGVTVQDYPQSGTFGITTPPWVSKNIWLQRNGTSADEFEVQDLPTGLEQSFRGRK